MSPWGKFGFLLAALFGASLSQGCATGPLPTPPEDVAKQRESFESDLIAKYEQKRDWALYQAAQSRLEVGDLDGSRDDVQRLLSRTPDHPQGVKLLAHIEEIERATAGDPSESDNLSDCATSPQTAKLLGEFTTLLSTGQPQAAVVAVRQALAIEPNRPQIATQAALWALRRNQADVAAAILQDAVVRYPQSAGLYRLYGLALYRRGDMESSQVALRQALSLDNSDALAYFLLGHTLERLGQHEAARQHFQSARQLDPTLSLSR